MNKIFTIITILLFTVSVIAQVPQKMSYQAVVRDANGKLVSDHAVGMRVSILQGTTPVYVETHNTKTNLNGLVSIEVGNGTLVQGIDLQSIDWSQGSFFIKTETDPTGGTNYTAIVGTSQLLSVPFALHSKTAESLSGTIAETDPIFVGWDKSLGIEISSSQISDFQSAVSNNPAVLANTSKNSYPAADAAKLAAITGINTGDQVLPTLESLGAVARNSAITGATKTKITYDAKGLVIGGANATTADIAASTDRNYVSDAQQTVLENTSGINTGDETDASIKAKLGITTLSGDNTGDQVLPTLESLGAVARNSAITGATKTRITYDAKGLVIGGANATTADIAASTDRNYVSDAQQMILENTSGINTGDETDESIKAKLGITILSGDNTGDQDLSGKVDKIEGKGLSTNDYTTVEQSKLAAIASGAEVNVQADWNQADNTMDDFIKNKPLNVSSFTNDAIYLKASNNLSDVLNTGIVRSNLGLGTMATQESNAVAINGGSLNGTIIGLSVPSTGAFTVLSSNGNTILGDNAGDMVYVRGALRIESGFPGAGKVLTSDVNGNASWKTPTTPTIEITRSRFLLTNDVGAYIINGQSLEESVDIADYRNQFIAPFDGRLVKIVVKTDVPMGSTVVKMYKNRNSTAIESQTVDVAVANTAYTFTFTTATFLAGDDLEIYVDPTNVGGSGCKVSFSIVWQY